MGHPLCLQRSVRLSVEEICSVGDSTRRGKRSEAKFEQRQYSTDSGSGFLIHGSWFWFGVRLDTSWRQVRPNLEPAPRTKHPEPRTLFADFHQRNFVHAAF